MTNLDEAKRLRVRGESLEDAIAQDLFSVDLGAPSLVAQTTVLMSYPNAARVYYTCVPVAVLGTESEGDAADFSPLTTTFLAANLGGSIPPRGTVVVVTFVGNRWVFRYDA